MFQAFHRTSPFCRTGRSAVIDRDFLRFSLSARALLNCYGQYTFVKGRQNLFRIDVRPQVDGAGELPMPTLAIDRTVGLAALFAPNGEKALPERKVNVFLLKTGQFGYNPDL